LSATGRIEGSAEIKCNKQNLIGTINSFNFREVVADGKVRLREFCGNATPPHRSNVSVSMGKRLTARLGIAFFVLILAEFLCAQTSAPAPIPSPDTTAHQASSSNKPPKPRISRNTAATQRRGLLLGGISFTVAVETGGPS
jgi:hypothetical protein